MSNVTVYIRGKSIWCSFSFNGTQYRKPFKIKNTKYNLKLANNRALELENMLDENIMPADADIIIRPFIKKSNDKKSDNINLQTEMDRFLVDDTLSKRSKAMYQATFKKFNEVIDASKLNIKDINKFHYETFKKYLLEKHSYNTSRTYLNYLRIYFARLIENGNYSEKNPFERLKRKDKQFIRTVPDSQLEMILNYLQKNDLNIYRIIYFISKTGFRLNEAVELKWEQIKWREKMIDVYNFKDNRYDLFPLDLENGTLTEFLSSFKKDEGKVFDVNYHWVTKPYQRAIKEINEQKKKKDKKYTEMEIYTVHDLRRTFGSRYAKKLMPLELMKLMRHKNIETTMHYYVNMQINDIVDKLNNNH